MRSKIETQIRDDAATDPAFRAALISDPAAALSERYGTAIPDALSLRVVEESPDEVLLVLPSADFDAMLSESDLDIATGAETYGNFTDNHCRP